MKNMVHALKLYQVNEIGWALNFMLGQPYHSALSSEYKYFEKTLEIHEDMDIINNLMRSGIIPSNDKTYELNEFIKGFEEITGGSECEIKCAEGLFSGIISAI